MFDKGDGFDDGERDEDGEEKRDSSVGVVVREVFFRLVPPRDGHSDARLSPRARAD